MTAHAASSWQSVRSSVAIRGMATNGTLHVAAGSNGIWTSNDLQSWQRASLPSEASVYYNDVIWDGSQFIAVGDGVITSVDGKTWIVRYAPDPDNEWSAVTYGKGIYLVVGDAGSSVLRSTNGHSWTPVSSGLAAPNSTSGSSLTGVASDGSQFVAIGYNYTVAADGTENQSTGIIITSPDGTTWTPQSVPPSDSTLVFIGWGNNAAWGNGTWVVGGGGAVYTSTDGVTWVSHDLSNFYTDNSAPIWIMSRIAFVNGKFVGAGFDTANYAAVVTSDDGVTWVGHKLAPRGASLLFGTAAIEYSSGRYIVGGYTGVFSSVDAVNWKTEFTGPQTNLSACIVQGGGRFVIPGHYGSIASSDGVTWPDTLSGSDLRNTFTGKGCATYGSGEYVAVENGGEGIAWSPDGKTWTFEFTPGTIYGVAWDGGRFVGVGTIITSTNPLPAVFTSADGKTWKYAGSINISGTTIQFGAGEYEGGGFTYENNTYIAWGTADNAPFIATSTDASTWNVTTSGLPADMTIASVAYGNGLYVAIGNKSDRSTVILTSTDGVKWTEESGIASGTATSWSSLLWNGSQFMAGGQRYDGGRRGAFLSSSDGKTWTLDTTDQAFDVYDIAWDGSQYVAAADYDVLEYNVGSGSSSSSGGSSSGGSSSNSGSGGGGLGLLALALLAGIVGRPRRLS
ncbi:MAG TPA: hypothetical protein VFK12_02405 [Gammaproteobacteria bacterium]|nr:hypothetical protein [Gammaproteobacteria bacterium]